MTSGLLPNNYPGGTNYLSVVLSQPVSVAPEVRGPMPRSRSTS